MSSTEEGMIVDQPVDQVVDLVVDQVEQSSAEPTTTVTAAETIDTIDAEKMDVEEETESMEGAEHDASNIENEIQQLTEAGRPVRKRKQTDFFDGDKVQPKKPRARTKKVPPSTSTSDLTRDDSMPVTPKVEKLTVEEELELALADDGEEGLDPRDADEYNPSGGKRKRSSSSKRATKKASGGGDEGAQSAEAALEPAAPAEPIVLPPEVQLKIAKFGERISELTAELSNMEKHADFIDINLDLDSIPQEIDRFIVRPVGAEFLNEIIDADRAASMKAAAVAAAAAPSEAKTTDDAMDVDGAEAAPEADQPTPAIASPESPEASTPADAASSDHMELNDQALAQASFSYIRSVMTRCMQGNSCGLGLLTESVISKLTIMVQHLQSLSLSESETRVRDAMLQQLESLGDTVALETEMKLCASRVSYGLRDKQSAFDNTDFECIWRWEANSLPSFKDVSQKLIKEARALRNRYSRAIRAAATLIQHLQKKFDDEAKTLALEEKAVKAMAEIEKFKEKRREIELKRQHDLEEKMKREEAKEKKRKEKEEADLLKKQQQEEAAAAKAAAKAAAQAEKDRKKAEEEAKKAEEEARKAEEEAKKQQKLHKQKSFFTSFFKPGAAGGSATKATPAAASPSSSSANLSAATEGEANATASGDKTVTAAVATAPSKSKGSAVTVVDLAAEEERHREFVATLQSNMTMADIQRSYVERRAAKLAARKAQRATTTKRSKTITVPVEIAKLSASTAAAAAFGEEQGYIEIEHRTFRNRVNTYSYWEDTRPAYVGTWSKKSRLITGRRPFAQDEEMLRYDYDSEEEWEEEGEGEDIAMSDGSRDEEDDEEGGNELEYDDFFRHDNDFGSDIDSDDEGMVCTSLPMSLGKMKEESVGPRFITNKAWRGSQATVVGAEGFLSLDRSQAGRTWMASPRPEVSWCTECVLDDEAQKLAQYTCVVFTPANLRLVTTTAAPTAAPSSAAKETATGAAPSSSARKRTPKGGEAAAVTPDGKAKAPSGDATTEEAAETAGASSAAKVIKGFDETKIGDLVQLVHGSKDGVEKLVNAFVEQNAHVSKAQTKKRILEIAEKKKHADGYGSLRWIVQDSVLSAATQTGVAPKAVEYTPVKTPAASSGKKRIVPSVVAAFSSAAVAEPKPSPDSVTAEVLNTVSTASSHATDADGAKPAVATTVAVTPSVKKRITPSVVVAFTSPMLAAAAATPSEKTEVMAASSCTALVEALPKSPAVASATKKRITPFLVSSSSSSSSSSSTSHATVAVAPTEMVVDLVN